MVNAIINPMRDKKETDSILEELENKSKTLRELSRKIQNGVKLTESENKIYHNTLNYFAKS